MDLTQKDIGEKYSIVANIISKGYIAHGGEKMFNSILKFEQTYLFVINFLLQPTTTF